MKRALLVLLLVVSCSHSSPKATAPSPTPSPTPAATASPTPSPVPTVTVPPKAAVPVGPVGTKVPKGFVPQSATFISDSTGWVLGYSPCPGGKGRCDVIARTRDGGRTWKAIPSPRTSPDKLAQIRFADARNGFVSGDDLWATHDGGATWKVVPGVGDVLALAASAGRIWVNVDQELRSAPAAGGPFVVEQGEVGGFALNHELVVYNAMHSELKLYATKHGGDAATGVEVPCEDTDGVVVGLGSTTHWFLLCEGDAGLGHQEKTAYQSFDAGRTWKAAGQPPDRTGSDVYVTSDGTFVFDHQGVAVYRGGVWKSALDTGGGIGEGGFESARMGFCIGGFGDGADQTMVLTRDAGRTWKPVAF